MDLLKILKMCERCKLDDMVDYNYFSHSKFYQLITYEDKTGKKAVWSGRVTNGFKEWYKEEIKFRKNLNIDMRKCEKANRPRKPDIFNKYMMPDEDGFYELETDQRIWKEDMEKFNMDDNEWLKQLDKQINRRWGNIDNVNNLNDIKIWLNENNDEIIEIEEIYKNFREAEMRKYWIGTDLKENFRK